MSSSDSDGGSEGVSSRDILRTRQWVRSVRGQYFGELAQSGRCTRDTHQLLQTAVLRYWDALHEYADEVEDDWEERGLDKIPGLARQTVKVPVKTPGRGQHMRKEERPAISQVDAESLVELTHRLDEIAYKLGFGAQANKRPTKTEITEEMVEEVEKWRKQNLE